MNPVLTTSGNALTFTKEPNGPLSDELYETNFGVSAGINTIGTDDELDPAALAKAVASGGLAVSGTTNAPAGATVLVQLYGASASTNTLNSPVVTGTADGAGHWSATVPVAFLQQTGHGPYALVVQIATTTGASFFSVRDFILDTKPPAAPDAPKLDAGSDTSLAADGSATNQDMPVITGVTEAGAIVTLFDTSSATPDTPIGTAVADGTGLYAITTPQLSSGKHTLGHRWHRHPDRAQAAGCAHRAGGQRGHQSAYHPARCLRDRDRENAAGGAAGDPRARSHRRPDAARPPPRPRPPATPAFSSPARR